jgi:hypothetical protein
MRLPPLTADQSMIEHSQEQLALFNQPIRQPLADAVSNIHKLFTVNRLSRSESY